MLKAIGLISFSAVVIIKILNAVMWYIATHSENCKIIADTALSAMCK